MSLINENNSQNGPSQDVLIAAHLKLEKIREQNRIRQDRFIQNRKNERQELKNQVALLQNQIQSSGVVSPSQLQYDPSTHNSQIQQYISTISSLSIQLQQLQTENTSLRSNVSSLNNQFTERNSTINVMRQQISDKDQTITQLQSQNSDKDQTITQLQQQVFDKDQTITQLSNIQSDLQTQLSNCVTTDVDRRLQEMSQTLDSRIQQEQLCLQTINQLNSANSDLTIYRDIVTELNNKYPKILPSFVSEIQRQGNESAHPEINNWASEQVSRILPSEIVSLSEFTNQCPSPALLQPQIVSNVTSAPVIQQPIINSIHSDPQFQRYAFLKRSLGITSKTKANWRTPSEEEYHKLYNFLYKKYRFVPDI